MTLQIHQTRDYDIFEFYSGNRNVDVTRVKDLLKSFNERYYPVPIIVDENKRVLDGQHRLEAAKLGGFPVSFLVLDDIVPTQVIRQLNTGQKPHTLPDYMKLYVEDGRGDYIQFQNLYEHYDKMLDEVGVTVNSGGPNRIIFTSMLGLLCGRDITTLDYLIKIFSVLPRQRANGRLHRNRFIHLRTREYLCSLHYLLHYRNEHTESENEVFDPQVFLTQAETYPGLLHRLEDKPKEWTNALSHIETVYNHKRGDRKFTHLTSL